VKFVQHKSFAAALALFFFRRNAPTFSSGDDGNDDADVDDDVDNAASENKRGTKCDEEN